MAPRRHHFSRPQDQNSAAQAANGSRNLGVRKHRPNEVDVQTVQAGLPSKVFGAVRIVAHQCLENVEYQVDGTDSISTKAIMLRVAAGIRAFIREADAGGILESQLHPLFVAMNEQIKEEEDMDSALESMIEIYAVCIKQLVPLDKQQFDELDPRYGLDLAESDQFQAFHEVPVLESGKRSTRKEVLRTLVKVPGGVDTPRPQYYHEEGKKKGEKIDERPYNGLYYAQTPGMAQKSLEFIFTVTLNESTCYTHYERGNVHPENHSPDFVLAGKLKFPHNTAKVILELGHLDPNVFPEIDWKPRFRPTTVGPESGTKSAPFMMIEDELLRKETQDVKQLVEDIMVPQSDEVYHMGDDGHVTRLVKPWDFRNDERMYKLILNTNQVSFLGGEVDGKKKMDVEVANFFIGRILAEYQFKNGQDDGAVRSIVSVFHRLKPRPPRGDIVYHLPIESLRHELPAALGRYTVLHTEVEVIRGNLVRPEDVFKAFSSQCSLLECTKFDGEMLRFYMKEMPKPFITSAVIEAFGKQPKSDIWVLSNCAFTVGPNGPNVFPIAESGHRFVPNVFTQHKFSPMEEESFPKGTIVPFPWLRWIIFCYGYNNLFPQMFENNVMAARISLAHIVQHGAHYKNWLKGDSGIGRNFPAAYLQSPDPGTGKTEILKTMNAIMCGPLKELISGDATKIGLWEQVIQLMGMTICVDDYVDSAETRFGRDSPEADAFNKILRAIHDGTGRPCYQRMRKSSSALAFSSNQIIKADCEPVMQRILLFFFDELTSRRMAILRMAQDVEMDEDEEMAEAQNPTYVQMNHWRDLCSCIFPDLICVGTIVKDGERVIDNLTLIDCGKFLQKACNTYKNRNIEAWAKCLATMLFNTRLAGGGDKELLAVFEYVVNSAPKGIRLLGKYGGVIDKFLMDILRIVDDIKPDPTKEKPENCLHWHNYRTTIKHEGKTWWAFRPTACILAIEKVLRKKVDYTARDIQHLAKDLPHVKWLKEHVVRYWDPGNSTSGWPIIAQTPVDHGLGSGENVGPVSWNRPGLTEDEAVGDLCTDETQRGNTMMDGALLISTDHVDDCRTAKLELSNSKNNSFKGISIITSIDGYTSEANGGAYPSPGVDDKGRYCFFKEVLYGNWAGWRSLGFHPWGHCCGYWNTLLNHSPTCAERKINPEVEKANRDAGFGTIAECFTLENMTKYFGDHFPTEDDIDKMPPCFRTCPFLWEDEEEVTTKMAMQRNDCVPPNFRAFGREEEEEEEAPESGGSPEDSENELLGDLPADKPSPKKVSPDRSLNNAVIGENGMPTTTPPEAPLSEQPLPLPKRRKRTLAQRFLDHEADDDGAGGEDDPKVKSAVRNAI